MAKKEKENLKGMKKDELKKKLTDLQEKIRSIRFNAEGSKKKNVKEYGGLKKEVARVMTVLNSKK